VIKVKIFFLRIPSPVENQEKRACKLNSLRGIPGMPHSIGCIIFLEPPNPHINSISHSQAKHQSGVCTWWWARKQSARSTSGLVMKEGLGCSAAAGWLTDWAGSERETRPQPARHNATLIDGASRAGWREMSRRGERRKRPML